MVTQQRHSLIFLGLLIISLCLSIMVGSCTPQGSHLTKNAPSPPPNVIRMGHQPHGTPLFLKISGQLEKRLAPLGFSVEWTEFPAGPPILAAMGDGKIDMGYAGVVPPIFAQAKGIPFVYIANDSARPGTMGIVVRQDAPIYTLADLKGKKIAATQSTASHYLLIQALFKAGLTLKDVEFVDLPPPKGLEAFKLGKVDAWIGWHPFLAQLQASLSVRLLANAEGLMNDRNFYLATRSFATNQADIVRVVIAEARKVGDWVNHHPHEAAKILEQRTVMTPEIALILTKSRYHETVPIEDRAIEEQQRVAETFFRLGLLPKRIWVEDAVWQQELFESQAAK